MLAYRRPAERPPERPIRTLIKSKLSEALSRRVPASRGDDLPALDQIERLTEENRRRTDPKRESQILRARHRAFTEIDRSAPDSAPEMLSEVSVAAGAWELVGGLPSVPAGDLSAELIRAAFLEYGSLLVRGLVPAGQARELTADIDKAFEARDAFLDGAVAADTRPWFEPFRPDPEYLKGEIDWNRTSAGGGSVWAADSPRMMFELLETFAEAGIDRVITDYLGERPVMSMKKSVLRRVTPDSGTSWHQDGAFLGEGLRTLNVWLALNRCGDVAPGMDILPRRLDEIVPTGTEGAMFEWAVSDQLVDELAEGRKPSRPIFEPGDALLFDHLCLHRTASEPTMTEQRYATETWCFAGSTYPEQQVPLVL